MLSVVLLVCYEQSEDIQKNLHVVKHKRCELWIYYTTAQCGQNNPQLNFTHQHSPEYNSQSEIRHMRVTYLTANPSSFYSNDPMRLVLMCFLQDAVNRFIFDVWMGCPTKYNYKTYFLV